MLNQMYEDVPTSNIPNKVRVIELVNENVISFSHPRILKTPTAVMHLGFFFVLKSNEQSNDMYKVGFS